MIPDETQRGRVVTRQPRARYEARVKSIHRQPPFGMRKGGGLDPARQFVGEPQITEFAIHVGEAPLELARAGASGRRECCSMSVMASFGISVRSVGSCTPEDTITIRAGA